jgi:uncharacterized protein
LLFSSGLPWRQKAILLSREFPQFNDPLVIVVNARLPEEAENTAGTLAKTLAADSAHFRRARPRQSRQLPNRDSTVFVPALLWTVPPPRL